MITRFTWVRIAAFVAIAVVVLAYVAERYTDLGPALGMRGYYTVNLRLPQTGGLFPNADVAYRGVSVGRVGAIRLADDGGVTAELHIDDSAPRIPADGLKAAVANLSAVGEEYVDLRPVADGGPYLAEGATVRRADASVPAPVTNLLTSIDSLAGSVPLADLRTVVSQFGTALDGQGRNLQNLLASSQSFLTAAQGALPDTTALIDDGHTVLATQNRESAAITGFAHSAELLAARLKESDQDLRRLVVAAPQAAAQVSGLINDLSPDLSVVLANLLTVSDIAVTRQAGVQELLVDLPQVAAAGSTAITRQGANFGMALTFFSPLPCTAGYGGTAYRNGLDTATDPGSGFDTAAGCTAPAASGQDVRGSAHAPYGGGVPAAAPPGQSVATASKVSADGLPGVLSAALPGGAGGLRSLLLPNGGSR